ncbi:MAG: hypothetical protein R2848_16850 [Thermomicrobiales bacterium]
MSCWRTRAYDPVYGARPLKRVIQKRSSIRSRSRSSKARSATRDRDRR